MLASHIAAEINQRWTELEQLPVLQRQKALESLVERHVLATGPCSTGAYVPSFEEYSDLASRGSNGDSDRE